MGPTAGFIENDYRPIPDLTNYFFSSMGQLRDFKHLNIVWFYYFLCLKQTPN